MNQGSRKLAQLPVLKIRILRAWPHRAAFRVVPPGDVATHRMGMLYGGFVGNTSMLVFCHDAKAEACVLAVNI